MTSLSEIQAILQTSDAAQRKPTGNGQGQEPPVVADTTPRTVGAPVPSAAEIRASREARWQEEMAEAQRAPAPAARRLGAVTWLLVAVGLAGGGLSGWFFWPEPPPSVTPTVEPVLAVRPPAIPIEAPIAAPPTAASIAVAAVESAAPTAPPSVASTRGQARRKVSSASRQRASAVDAAFGPRPTQSRGKIVAKPKVKRKKTRADSQLDSVLDGL